MILSICTTVGGSASESPSPTTQKKSVELDDDSWLQVMDNLEASVIIRLRQVDKRLYRLTHEQSIWIHKLEILREKMIVPHNKTSDVSPEVVVMRCLKLEQLWTGRKSETPRVRSVDVLRSGVPYSLVTGIMIEDRPWLLTAERRCSFHLWDLSLEKPKPHYVGKHPEDQRAWYYELYRDEARLAGQKILMLATLPLLGSGGDVRHRIDMFRFNLDKRYMKFIGSIRFCHQVLTIRVYGDYLLATTMEPRFHIEIANWRQAISQDTFEYWEGTDPHPEIPSQGMDAHLLESKQVIACFDDHIALYPRLSFQMVSVSTFQEEAYKVSQAMSVFPFADLKSPGPSSAFVTTLKRRERSFLRIYRDDAGNFQAVSKTFEHTIRSMHVGFHRTLVVTEDNEYPRSGRIVHFVTTDDILGSSPITVYTPGIKANNVFGVVFCEATGTICLFDTAKIDVHDFML